MVLEDAPEILTCEMTEYLGLPSDERRPLVDELASYLGEDWCLWNDDERVLEHLEIWPSQSYFDRPLQMSLIPGGSFEPGLSARERRIAERWVETGETDQDPEVLELCVDELLERQTDGDEATMTPFLMSCVPMRRREFESLQEKLPDLRVPTDFEWEWAVRAGSRTMFWWGDEPPEQMIDAPHHLPEGHHPLVLREIGWEEEHCAGELEPQQPPYFVRGGVADCCPWQGTAEFTLLLSSYRRSSTSEWTVTRPVIPLS